MHIGTPLQIGRRRRLIAAQDGARHLRCRAIVLSNQQSPGDIVALTAAVRDLQRANPGRFVVQVDTCCPAIWENNPYVTIVNGPDDYMPGSEVVQAQYPAIHQSNQRPRHFIEAFHEHLAKELRVRIPVTDFKADIHLSDEEKQWPNDIEGLGEERPFWIMVAGGKYDFTAKWWDPANYQAVVDHFRAPAPGKPGKPGSGRARIEFVQCGEAGHWHEPLDGVTNLVGKTTLRQFLRLMYHASGVVCPVTMAMHAAAAVPTPGHARGGGLRPCVVIAGGREPAHWEQYPGHQFLHTIGSLDCCATGGCWKSRCQLVGDGDAKDRVNVCERPVDVRPNLRLPECMTMIEPRHVIAAIEWYLGFEESDNGGDGRLDNKKVNGESGVLSPSPSPSLKGGGLQAQVSVIGNQSLCGIWADRRGEEMLNESTSAARMGDALESLPAYPGGFDGRGVVIAGGGAKYFPSAWVNIRMLRQVQCELPIELWHLGPGEMPEAWRRRVAEYGVRCVDAEAVSRAFPARILNGWELKPFAILLSTFAEVLFLDADNMALRDPGYLFESAEYREHGAVFWPDLGRLGAERAAWRLAGVDFVDEPEFESGQMVVDKRRCWRALLLTMWMNEHSDFWYRFVHGDKETFHLAWRRCGQSWAMPSRGVERLAGKVMCQHDFVGRRLFQHRNLAKWRMNGNERIAGFEMEAQCERFLAELWGAGVVVG